MNELGWLSSIRPVVGDDVLAEGTTQAKEGRRVGKPAPEKGLCLFSLLASGSIPHPRGIWTPTPPGPRGARAAALTPPGDGQNPPVPDSLLSQVQAGVWAQSRT